MYLQSIERLDDLFELDTVTRIERIAAAQPDKLAVKSVQRSLSYGGLDQEAGRLAAALGPLCGSQPFVALLFEHGVDMVVGALGAMKAGMGYVPLDGAYPLERLQYMWNAAGRPVIVTMDHLVPLARQLSGNATVVTLSQALQAGAAGATPAARSLDAPAYLLFTSGSTGQPKGVMQTHRNLLYHTWVWVTRLGVTQQDGLSLQSAYSWDSSVQDIFSALLTGASLYPVNLKAQGLAETVGWMREQRVSVYHSTVPIFRQVMQWLREQRSSWPSLRMVAVGGDSVFATDLARSRETLPGCRLAYAYGATESSSILMNVVEPDQAMARTALPLGTPAAGVEVYLDETGRDVPGEGEIVIASPYVCKGYHGQDLEAPKFTVDEAQPGLIHYRTGDLGTRLEDGTVALLGRIDNLLKVRGMRVDPSEVEGVLNALPGVRTSVVHPAPGDSDRLLVAYVVRDDAAPRHNTSTLRAALAQRLPAHAVPSRYVFLTALPFTPNGKIDRQALPLPGADRPELEVAFAASQSRLQERIASVWQAALRLKAVGINDNFFDLGGHSLLMARVHGLLQEELGRTIPLFQLYAHPTIAALASFMERDEQQRSALEAAQRRAQLRQSRRASAN